MFQIKQVIPQKNIEQRNFQPVTSSSTSKILVYGDAHFSSTSSVLRQRGEFFTCRLESLINTFNFINKTAENLGISDIYCVGDLFDRPNLTAEELTALKQCDLSKHTVILGNHEVSGKDMIFNTVNGANVKEIIYKPEIRGDIAFLPYCSTTSPWDLNDVKGCKLLLSHIDIKNIQNGTYYSNVGYDVKELLDCSKLTINGHLHTYNWVTPGRLLNIGAVVGINFACTHENFIPHIAVVDLDTLSVEFIDNPYSYLFYSVYIKDELQLEEFVQSLPKGYEGKYVITLKCPSHKVQQFRNTLESLVDMFYIKFVPDYSMDNFEASVDEDVKLKTFQQLDGIQSLREFVTQKFGNDKNVKVMLQEIEECCK